MPFRGLNFFLTFVRDEALYEELNIAVLRAFHPNGII